VREVVINGVRYAAPFADLFRDLTPAERSALADSARRDGIHTPVLVYDSSELGRAVIDGLNRAEVAAGLALELRVVDFGPISDEEARRIAEDVNAARRHLTPEEQQRVRAERVERVAEKRAEGKSLRTIADEVGVSAEQVRQDVKEATVKGLTVEPEKVVGKDGKTRPAKQPRPEPVKQAEPLEDDDVDAVTDHEPDDAPTDPDAWFKSKESFADEIVSAIRYSKKLTAAVSAVFESPHADLARALAAQHRQRWSPDGSELELSNRLGVQVMLRTWSCEQVESLYRFLCDLNVWLRKPDAREVTPPWEVGE
jgi:DNA-binding Lrp family transcriptional regulator